MTNQVWETTIFNGVPYTDARMLYVPADVVAGFEQKEAFPPTLELELPEPSMLGIRLGVRIPDPDGLVDVFYASLQGRVYTFDQESFDRWRPRWQADRSDESVFAQELVYGKRTPITQSPLRAESMASLIEHGEAFVANGAQWTIEHPVHALGVVILVRGSILVAAVGHALTQTVVIAAKYHLRQALGVPVDWVPPEDRL